MTLQIYPFSASESKIDGLRIINVKMVTDDRGTVRELYRESSPFRSFTGNTFFVGNR